MNFNRTKWFLSDPSKAGQLNPGVLVSVCSWEVAPAPQAVRTAAWCHTHAHTHTCAQSVPTIYPEMQSTTPGATEELVFFGSSSDHNVYALDLEECTKNMPPANTENTEQMAAPCLRWKTDLGGSIFAGVRATAQGLGNTGENIMVFASTTSLLDATSGVMHALNVNGTLLWSFPMEFPVVDELSQVSASGRLAANVSTTGIRNIVAIDATNHMLLVASGHRLLALQPDTGTLIAEFIGDVEDPFVSAPVLSPEDKNVYLHSANGSLWKLSVGVLPAPQFYGFNLVFKCNYYRGGPDEILHSCSGTNAHTPSAVWVSEEQAAAAYPQPLPVHLVHTSADGSRGMWVHVKGVTATSRVAGPYSTPAMGEFESNLFLSLYQPAPANGALIKVDTASGVPHWSFSGLYLGSEHAIPFGSSESSPAVDASGDVYVASDSTHGPVPVLFALTHDGLVQWTQLLGTANIDEVGFISPVIAESPANIPRVYMATTDTLFLLEQGCPSDSVQTECSGNGACNCASKVCSCDAAPGGSSCFTGDDCSQPKCGSQGECDPDTGACHCFSGCMSGEKCDIPYQCGPNASCDPGKPEPNCQCDECFSFQGLGECQPVTCAGHGSCRTGECHCNSDFTQPRDNALTCVECPFCAGGPACSVLNTCSGHGTCDSSGNVCKCTGGWAGIYCDVPISNSGDSPPRHNGPSPGGVAASVVFALVAVTAICFVVYARVKYPGRAYADACPSPLQPACRALPSCRSIEQSCIGLCSKKTPALASAPAYTASSATSPGAGYGSGAGAAHVSKGASKASYTSL